MIAANSERFNRGDLERRVPVIEGVRRLPPDFAHADCAAFATVPTMRIREAPFARATAAVAKARNVSITATAPVAVLAPSNRLWIEIFIGPVVFGSVERSVWQRLARASG